MKEAEIDALPDPMMFRDAILLAGRGTWSADDLNATDAILYEVTQKILRAQRGIRRERAK